jgi:hypothetical protein
MVSFTGVAGAAATAGALVGAAAAGAAVVGARAAGLGVGAAPPPLGAQAASARLKPQSQGTTRHGPRLAACQWMIERPENAVPALAF